MPKLTTLAIVFILMAAIGFVFTGLIAYSMYVRGIPDPTGILRMFTYGLASIALIILAKRDSKDRK